MRATLFGFAVALATVVVGRGVAAPPVERPVARPVEAKTAKVEPKVETKAAQAPKLETKAAKVEAQEFARPKLETVPNPQNEKIIKHHLHPYASGNGMPRGSKYLTELPKSVHDRLHSDMRDWFKTNTQFNETINGKSISPYPYEGQQRAKNGVAVDVPLEKRIKAFEQYYTERSKTVTGVDLTTQYRQEVATSKALGKLKRR